MPRCCVLVPVNIVGFVKIVTIVVVVLVAGPPPSHLNMFMIEFLLVLWRVLSYAPGNTCNNITSQKFKLNF